ALLDTGVDRHQASLLGSVDPGIDVVDPKGDATPQAPPGRPLDVERHGTEMAGILVGDHGPPAANGIARGATVLPIRVAGWQPDGSGGYAVYSRTDQLIEGLERAVDPNADGDAHDAARVALVGVAAPFAGFADDPAARAVEGALALNTLVVAPAGNDGPAEAVVGGMLGAVTALLALPLVLGGVLDQLLLERVLHLVLLHGGLARVPPLPGALPPERAVTPEIGAPALVPRHASFTRVDAYFDQKGLSRVAGRAALVPAGPPPAEPARSAARAGATAVVLYGRPLPAG